MLNVRRACLPLMMVALMLAGCGRESADWKSATAANTVESYQQFVQQHPNSAQAAQAQSRISELGEERDWQQASASDTRAAYEQFVSQHADSKWAQEARIRIENFAQATPVPAAASATASAVDTPNASSTPAGSSPAQVASNPRAPPGPHAKPVAPAKLTSAAPAAKTRTHEHVVQLGAFKTRAGAESHWKVLTAKYPTQLHALTPHYVPAHAGKLVRLQVDVSSSSSARGLCATLKKHAQACVPVTA